jgi:Tol biopolymer transport system component
MSGKYALIIGNAEYIDPKLPQLTAPIKDAEDFAYILKDQDICAFDEVNTLLNQPSTSVIEAIDEFFDQKRPDDMLVLYFSGHGIKDELGSLYLAFKNTIRSRLRATAIKSDYIREAMDQSRSKRQVLILDCCNSGAFPPGTKAELGGPMGMAKAFQGYGRFVLTASDATQLAWEGDQVIGETDKSLFTHFLIKGLKGEADGDSDGRITVDELYDYAYDEISKVTPKQTPRKSAEKVEGEIVLRQNMRIEDIKPVALPDDLINEIEDLRPSVREWAVQRLEKILKGKNLGLARSARDVLEKLSAEDDSRRVAKAANQILEPIHQQELQEKLRTEQIAKDIIRETSLAMAHEIDAIRKEQTQGRVVQGVEEEQKIEQIAMLKIEEERLAREKAETQKKTEAELKAKEEAQHLAAQKAQAKIEAVRKAKEESKRLATKERNKKWGAFVNSIQLTLKNNPKLYIWFGMAILLVAVMAILINRKFYQTNLLYSGISEGKTDVYSYDGKTETKIITNDMLGIKNWSPVSHPTSGQLYFTSNKDGTAEIYRMKSDGNAEQVTDGQGIDANWAPAFDLFGQLYFTSNRDNTAEIYRMKSDGNAEQVTDGQGNEASWEPAFDLLRQLYFTSNRDGSAEIYRIKSDGNVEQVTDGLRNDDASWGPAFDLLGQLYFTSNRDGSAEVYRMKSDGDAEQVTDGQGNDASWGPVFEGNNFYFTSNRNGHDEVFLFVDAQAISISSIDKSWTTPLSAKYPLSGP